MEAIALVGAAIAAWTLWRAWMWARTHKRLLTQLAATTLAVAVFAGVFTQADTATRIRMGGGVLVALAVVVAVILNLPRTAWTPPTVIDDVVHHHLGYRWPTVRNRWGREDFTYAFGTFDKRSGEFTGRVKFGHSAQPEGVREQQVADQMLRADEIRALARGPGGERRERYIHRRLDYWRYKGSEWFEASPEVLDAVSELERLTSDGIRVLKHGRRAA